MSIRAITSPIRVPLALSGGHVEVFANGGAAAIPVALLVPPEDQTVEILSQGGKIIVERLTVHRLNPGWR
ncbi:MAG TPA: hypothetical protein VIL46_16470 [Gemmataceae bacterium]